MSYPEPVPLLTSKPTPLVCAVVLVPTVILLPFAVALSFSVT